MSSEEKNHWVFLADFNPFRFDDNETKLILTKKLQNQTFRCHVSFKIQLQTFPWKSSTTKLQPEAWPTDVKDSFQLTLQQCSSTQKSEGEVYPLKTTESNNIYCNTKIRVNRVEHQTLETLETGLTDPQQQSQFYINTARGKARPQDAQTSDINPHCAFVPPIFWIKVFQVTLWFSPIRSFLPTSSSEFASTKSGFLFLMLKQNLNCLLLLQFWKT